MKSLAGLFSERRDAILYLLGLSISFGAAFYFFYPAIVGKTNYSIGNHDAFHLVSPFYSYFVDSQKTFGKLDPWNPLIWGGMPGIGNPNVPMNIIIYLMSFLKKSDFFYGLNFLIFLQVLFAATGMFALLNRLTQKPLLSSFGAVSYIWSASTAFSSAYFGFYVQFTILPWVAFSLITLNQQNFTTKLLFLTFLFYFQITYNHPQLLLYSLLSIGFFPYLWRDEIKFKKELYLLVASFFLGNLLASHSTLPLLDFLTAYKNRQQGFNFWDYANKTKVPLEYLYNLIVPKMYSFKWWPLWADGWSMLESYFCFSGHIILGGSFLGILYSLLSVIRRDPFGTAIHANTIRRLSIFIIIFIFINSTTAGVFVVGKLTGGTAVAVSRSTIFLPFFLIISSILVLTNVTGDNFRWRLVFAGCLTLMAVLLLLQTQEGMLENYIRSFHNRAELIHAIADKNATTRTLEYKGTIRNFISEAAIQLLYLALPFFLASLPMIRKKNIVHLLIGFSCVYSLNSVKNFYGSLFKLFTEGPEQYYPYPDSLEKNNPVLSYLKKNLDKDLYMINTSLDRDVVSGLTPNQNAIYGIPSINGYTSVVPRDFSFEQEFYRANFSTIHSPNMQQLYSVRYIATSREIPEPTHYKELLRWEGLSPIQFGPGERIILYEFKNALAKFYFPETYKVTTLDQYRKMLSDKPLNFQKESYLFAKGLEKLFVPWKTLGCRPHFKTLYRERSNYSLLIQNDCVGSVGFAMNQPSFRWWRYMVDGKMVSPQLLNGIHKILEIPSGTHTLYIHCYPLTWYVGIAISIATFLAIIMYCVIRMVRRT